MNKASLFGFAAGLAVFVALTAGYLAYKGAFSPEKEPSAAPPARPVTELPKRPPVPAAETPKPPPAPEKPAVQMQTAALKLERTLAGQGAYAPGGTLEVAVAVSKKGEEPIRAMGLQEYAPEGWVFDGIVEGDRPDLVPPAGRKGILEFAWFNIPEYPTKFTYRLRVPEGADGRREVRGQVLYRTDGPELRTDMLVSPLEKGEAAAAPAPALEPEPAAEEAKAAPLPDWMPAAGPGLQIAHSVPDDSFTPGQPLEITVGMNCGPDEPVTAMAVVEQLPEGWTFAALGEGDAPAIKPKPGAGGRLDFVWINVPKWPAVFSFSVNVPPDETESQTLSGQALFRLTGPEEQSAPVVTVLKPRQP